ncbi:MAG: hypothetical protein JRE28_04115, partial [Deltaproteobacteria bacterium]|nr:hypothetical protein [Deltaproteobacteria bacterium]
MKDNQMEVDEKFDRQCALEMEGFSLGQQRYDTFVESVQSNKFKDNTLLKPEQKLMQNHFYNLVLSLNKLIHCNKRFSSERTRDVRDFLKQFKIERLSYLTLRFAFNVAHRKNNLTSVAVELGREIEKDLEYLQFQKEAPAYLSKVEYNLRSSHLRHRQRVLDHAKHKVIIKDKAGNVIRKGIPDLSWNDEIRFYIGKLLLEGLTQTKPKLFKIDHRSERKSSSKGSYGFISIQRLIFKRTEFCEILLEKSHLKLRDFSPLVYPCIISPKHWEGAYGGAFWTQYKSLRTKLFRSRNKQVPINAENHGIKLVTKAVNIIQDSRFRINRRVFDVMQQAAKQGIGGLPAADQGRIAVNGRFPLEEPSPWTNEEFRRLKKSKNEEVIRWLAEKSEAYDLWNRHSSSRQALIWKLKIADKFKDEPEIYFAWNCDYRGRVYCYQPFINPQVDDSGKALIEFANGKALGQNGYKHLCIHGANVFGYDKASLDERVAWVEQHRLEIQDSANNPLDGNRFWESADKPYNFLAFCFEYADYIKLLLEGKNPNSFISHLPVQQDGTCSGLQHYSALLRDNIGGKVVNLIPSDEKADVYGKVAKVVNRKLKKDAEKGGEAEKYAKAWLSVGVDRKICKRNTMTFCYGSTRRGFTQQLIDLIAKEGIKLPVKDSFKACQYLGGVNWSAIGETLVKSVEGMEFLQKIAFFMAKNQLDIQWTTPIG